MNLEKSKMIPPIYYQGNVYSCSKDHEVVLFFSENEEEKDCPLCKIIKNFNYLDHYLQYKKDDIFCVRVIPQNFEDVIDKKTKKCELIIFTGNVGCGKSTLAREFVTENKDCIVVNDDAITTMLGGGDYTLYDKSKKYLYKEIELYCVDIGLGTNRSVVVDIPNMKRSSRKKFISIGKKYGAKIISYDWGPGKLEDLLRRQEESRGYTHWDEAYFRKQQKYEKPTMDEGFNEIVRVESTINDGNIIVKFGFEYE